MVVATVLVQYIIKQGKLEYIIFFNFLFNFI